MRDYARKSMLEKLLFPEEYAIKRAISIVISKAVFANPVI
jgi:hypothetical protein